MGNYRRNSILNLIFNYTSVVFNLITGIFLVPFYLRKIPLDAYGSFLAATAIAALIGLLEFGLSMVLTQRLARSYARSDSNDFRQVLFTGLVAATLLAVVICIVTLVVTPWIPTVTNTAHGHQIDLSTAFTLLGFAAASSVYLNLCGSIFQALLKAGTLGAVNLFSAAVGVVTVIVSFSEFGTLTAIAAGTIVRVGCATILLIFYALHALSKSSLLPRRAPLKDAWALLHSCVPVFVGGVAKSVADNTQNLVLANAVSPAAVAVLALTQKAFQVCNMVLAPIGSSIYANLTQIKEKTDESYFSSILGISIRGHFLSSVVLIATALSFNKPFVDLWVGADKFGGVELSFLLGVATLLTTRFSFFSFLIYSAGEFKKPLVLEASYSITKILLLLVLIQPLGLLAVPLADVIAGVIFLYSFSTRLMASHLRNSIFGSGIYVNGWFELVLLTAIGHGVIALLAPILSWAILGTSAIAFLLTATLVVLAFNTSFIKACVVFPRPRSRTDL